MKKGLKKGAGESCADQLKREKQIWTMKVLAYTQQETLDAAALALAECFGFGPERLHRFHDAFMSKYTELRKLEKGDTPDNEYYIAKVEEALKAAWGKYYEPRDYRYDFTLIMPSGKEYKL